MNKISYIIFSFLSVCLLTVSCTKEHDLEEGTQDQEYLSFILEHEFSDNGSKNSSRSSVIPSTPAYSTRGEVAGDNTYNENVFDWASKDLYILFFDYANQDKCLFFPFPEQLILENKDNGSEKVLKIKLSPDPDHGETFPPLDPGKMFGKNTVMYIVVNSGLKREDFMNDDGDIERPLSEIRDIVVSANFNKVKEGNLVPQEKFVMEAEQNFYIPIWPNITTVTLKRVAAKVQMGLYNASVNGYTAKSAEVKLVNYIDRSPLSDNAASFTINDDDYKSGDYLPLELPAAGITPSTVNYAEPFYSYPSDWSADQSKAAYLLVKMKWQSTVDLSEKDYYYKIPLSSIPADTENGAAFRHSLRRNYLYRYYITITTLGGDSPDSAEEITGNFDIMGWGDDENIEMSIQKFDWLFVDEHNIVLYPEAGKSIQEYFIPYKSNTDLKLTPYGGHYAKYEDYTGGTLKEEFYPYVDYLEDYGVDPADDLITQFPYVNPNYMDGNQRYIHIRSRTPINCVPKHMYIKLNNEAQLYAHIYITHYPALYVTAKTVSGQLSYTITTLAITGDEQFESNKYGSAIESKSYKVGSVFHKNSKGKIELVEDNYDNAWVVSPKFTVSYNSEPSTKLRSGAITYCQDLVEDGKSGWRLPTIAELYLINKLQKDDDNALKDALVGGEYKARAWAVGTYYLHGGRESNGVVFQMRRAKLYNEIIHDERSPAPNTGITVHVPVCVRDVYQ